MVEKVYVHPSALCESNEVGVGTKLWAFSHVMKGAVVGEDCNLGDHAFVETGAVIGSGVTIKNQVLIWEGVTIADGAFIGPGVKFTNDRYPRSPRLSLSAVATRYAKKSSWLCHTYVGEGASLGAGVVVAPGIRIGRFATIAAGAVVTKDVKDFSLMLGNPSRSQGWVCRCGVPLRNQVKDRFLCECGDKYELSEVGLILL